MTPLPPTLLAGPRTIPVRDDPRDEFSRTVGVTQSARSRDLPDVQRGLRTDVAHYDREKLAPHFSLASVEL